MNPRAKLTRHICFGSSQLFCVRKWMSQGPTPQLAVLAARRSTRKCCRDEDHPQKVKFRFCYLAENAIRCCAGDDCEQKFINLVNSKAALLDYR